jgi:hypothetical protein
LVELMDLVQTEPRFFPIRWAAFFVAPMGQYFTAQEAVRTQKEGEEGEEEEGEGEEEGAERNGAADMVRANGAAMDSRLLLCPSL